MKRIAWIALIGLAIAGTPACGDDDTRDGEDAGARDTGPRPDVPPGTDTGEECVMVDDEGTPATCDDGCDNDGDGFTDCLDFGCDGVGACGVVTCDEEGPENTAAACTDGCDNDANGFADCDDNACRALPECVRETSNTACSDGIDNDGNGFTDCEDFSCARDGAGAVVCVRESSNAACSDGIDNDGDGMTDCEDEGCNGREHIVVCGEGAITDPTLWADAVEERCSNGENDDGDMNDAGFEFTDCGDFDCINTWETDVCHDLPREAGNARCSDGVDNDMDGRTDCEESSCNAEGIVVCADGVAVEPTPSESEITTLANAICDDGMDNDENTFTDCGDFGCSQEPLVTVCGSENSDELCSDGMDNDENGFMDCMDFSCSRSPFVTVCNIENTSAECDDNMDNDGNGFKDCDDRNCEDTAVCRRFDPAE